MCGMGSDRGRFGMAVVLILLVVGAFFYLSGRLDPVLYRFGFNHNPCTHAVGGTIICGPGIAGTPYGNQ